LNVPMSVGSHLFATKSLYSLTKPPSLNTFLASLNVESSEARTESEGCLGSLAFVIHHAVLALY
jgi:hypothetical protein